MFLPSDHHVSNTAPITAALSHASEDGLDDRISLLGVTPTGPEVEYGWIVRGARVAKTGGYTVRQFLEKPTDAGFGGGLPVIQCWQVRDPPVGRPGT